MWILSPDDVARLFPCADELFDVVIVDEASQVDLPSLVPMAYRGQEAGRLRRHQADAVPALRLHERQHRLSRPGSNSAWPRSTRRGPSTP